MKLNAKDKNVFYKNLVKLGHYRICSKFTTESTIYHVIVGLSQNKGFSILILYIFYNVLTFKSK